ncbi:urate oxidase [Chlamydoabsidia padenii]|nr:urate oxidase [Chlamydoabsidia padenii]
MSANNQNVYLKATRYGKDLVRLMRVYREGQTQRCTELTLITLLLSPLVSQITGGNTCKNTVNMIAKRSPNVDNIELFAQEITEHVLKQYAHISHAYVDIIKHKWSRLNVDGKPHPHSFVRDGEEVQTCSVVQERAGNKITVKSGLKNLLVLKTTGSAFHGFYRDQYTTLAETWDRIFSTSVDCEWVFVAHDANTLRRVNFPAIHDSVKKITTDTFATDDSASVQATMYLMQTQALAKHAEIAEISYALPNKHYVGMDLSKLGIENSGKNTDIYYPQPDPSGLITATVARKPASKL